MISFQELKQEGCLFERGLSSRDEEPRDFFIFELTPETVYMTVSAKLELHSRLTKWEDLRYNYTCRLKALNLTTGLVEEHVFTHDEIPWRIGGIVKREKSAK